MSSFFDQLEEDTQNTNKNDKPFFKTPFDKDDDASQKAVHQWLKTERDFLYQVNKPRFENIKKNLALNKGLMYTDQDTRSAQSRETNSEVKKKLVQKIVINVLSEANRVRASRILKYKPAVAILPTNDELADKVAAESCEKLKDHIWYEQRFDGEKLPEIVTSKGPMGECFLFILWNPELGDLHAEYKKSEEYAKTNNMDRVPLLNGEGKPDVDEQGRPIYVDKPVRNGDVEYKVVYTLDCLFQRHPTRKLENAEYVFYREAMSVEAARLKWPKAADKVKGNKDTQFFDYEELSSRTNMNEVYIWHFYHRRTEELDGGRYIVFTDDGILENKEFPYSHRKLPCVRWIEKKLPGEQHGVSFFDELRGPAGAFNNITNMILRNEIMVGHPKWMMPAGAAKIEELGNAITVVQHKGPIAPKLVQANPTGQGAYQLRTTLQDEVFRQADISRTGNGEPPQGVTAAVAMQYLAELEAERWNEPVLYHNESVLQTVIMTLAVAGDYYDVTDKRMMRIQGKDDEWQSEFLDVAVLSKDYDVRIQGSSALPESKSARIETLLFLAKTFPQQVDPEQVMDMFDLAQNKKFIKEGTLSLRAAEAENEMVLSGKKIGAPENYEDQLVHWKTHVRKMREWSFKNRTPAETRKALEEHVMAHEYLIMQMAAKDPTIMQVLSTLPGFPLFYKPGMTPAATPVTPEEDAMAAAPVDPNAPIEPQPELPVQAPGEPAVEAVPPVTEQLGMETNPQEPTSGV